MPEVMPLDDLGSRKPTDAVLHVIQQILTPYVGKVMAESAALAHCRRLGLEGRPMVEPGEVESLLRKLQLGLVIFLGREKTDFVVGTLRRRISSLPELTH